MAFTALDWDAYVPIIVASAQVAATMPDAGESGFPCVLVIENGGDNYEGGAASIFSTVVSSANDIAVTLNDAVTQLKHDIVEYDATGGSERLVIHILIPSVAGASDTILRLYYRDDGAIDQQQTVYLSADNWVGYWPLQEAAAGTGTANLYKDLSDNLLHGDDYVSDTGKAGVVGLGQTFDGADDYIIVPNDAALDIGGDKVTLMCWAYSNAVQRVLIGRPHAAAHVAPFFKYVLYSDLGPDVSFRVDTTVHDDATNWSLGAWHHIAGVYNGSNLKLYIDAGTDGTTTAKAGNVQDNEQPFYFGRNAGGGELLDGSLDEASISAAARSVNWITTTYNCQNDNDAFWLVGDEVLVTATPPELFAHPGQRPYTATPGERPYFASPGQRPYKGEPT